MVTHVQNVMQNGSNLINGSIFEFFEFFTTLALMGRRFLQKGQHRGVTYISILTGPWSFVG